MLLRFPGHLFRHQIVQQLTPQRGVKIQPTPDKVHKEYRIDWLNKSNKHSVTWDNPFLDNISD